VFAVYVLVLLVTLLFFGSVSDYLGRLPVIIIALAFSAAGCAVFLTAHSTGGLYAARSLQGIATGLASGPIGAALIDLQPAGSQRAPLVTSAFSSLGLALGAVITSALVQYAPEPTRLIWWMLLAVFAAGIVAVLSMAEPGSRRPGVLSSLRPRVAVPRQAREPSPEPSRVSLRYGHSAACTCRWDRRWPLRRRGRRTCCGAGW
jgi:MFS family permease